MRSTADKKRRPSHEQKSLSSKNLKASRGFELAASTAERRLKVEFEGSQNDLILAQQLQEVMSGVRMLFVKKCSQAQLLFVLLAKAQRLRTLSVMVELRSDDNEELNAFMSSLSAALSCCPRVKDLRVRFKGNAQRCVGMESFRKLCVAAAKLPLEALAFGGFDLTLQHEQEFASVLLNGVSSTLRKLSLVLCRVDKVASFVAEYAANIEHLQLMFLLGSVGDLLQRLPNLRKVFVCEAQCADAIVESLISVLKDPRKSLACLKIGQLSETQMLALGKAICESKLSALRLCLPLVNPGLPAACFRPIVQAAEVGWLTRFEVVGKLDVISNDVRAHLKTIQTLVERNVSRHENARKCCLTFIALRYFLRSRMVKNVPKEIVRMVAMEIWRTRNQKQWDYQQQQQQHSKKSFLKKKQTTI